MHLDSTDNEAETQNTQRRSSRTEGGGIGLRGGRVSWSEDKVNLFLALKFPS